MKHRYVIFLLFLCATLPACESHEEKPDTQPLEHHGSYVHAASGMVFPTDVGPFQRRNIYPQAGDELDISYGSLSSIGPILITITLAPAPTQDNACRTEFDNRKQEIVAATTSGRWVDEGNLFLAAGGANYGGWMTSVDLMLGRSPVRGYVYVFCAKDWLLSYRITGPRGEPAQHLIEDFLAAMPAAPLQQKR
jgi:hypothetical protein